MIGPPSRHAAIGPALRLGFLLLAAGLTATALLLVPQANGPPAIALGVASAAIGAILGTGFAMMMRRIDPAPLNLQRRRSIALLAGGVLIGTSAAFLINAAALEDTGTGVELPVLAIAADGKVTTISPYASNDPPLTFRPRSGEPAMVGGCIWLAFKRGLLGAGTFEVAETRPCSPIRGRHRAGSPPAIILPANHRQTDWRWE